MGFYPDETAFAAQEAADALVCTRCGHHHLGAETISTAFWRDGGLVVIRDIPALVCPACREEFIADATALALDRMRGAGFAAEAAAEQMQVPVFRFRGGPRS